MRFFIATLIAAVGILPTAQAECAKEIKRMKAIESTLVSLDSDNAADTERGQNFSEEIFNLHEHYASLPAIDECQTPLWTAFVNLAIAYEPFQTQGETMIAVIADVAKNPANSEAMVNAERGFANRHSEQKRASCLAKSFRADMHQRFCYLETNAQACFAQQFSMQTCMK